MAVYSFQQLKDLWVMYGGSPNVANVAAAIALAESGGNSNATAHEPNGTLSRGLWQINSVHGANSSYDVATNVRAAVALYNSKGGKFTDWTTFNTGAYRKFLNGSPDTSGSDSGSSSGSEVSLLNPLDSLQSIADIASKLGDLVKGAAWFSDPHNIIRIAQVVGGGFLAISGVVMLSFSLVERSETGQLVSGVVKSAGKVAAL